MLIDGAGSGANNSGDTLDLSPVSEGATTVDLQGNALDIGSSSINILGFENVVGSSSNDRITGNGTDNILAGGEGDDIIVGGSGDDILLIDAEDTSVVGGEGIDTAFVMGTADIQLDMLSSGVEIAIGGGGNDTIISSGAEMIAGGSGDDTLRVDADLAVPAVVWGGEGADVIDIVSGPVGPNIHHDNPVGIMAVSVNNLSSESFPQFSLDMLGLGSNFDWSKIDVVILNPDSQDRITINGEIQGTEEVTEEVSEPIITDMGWVEPDPWDSYSYTGPLMPDGGEGGDGDEEGGDGDEIPVEDDFTKAGYYVAEYEVGFLGGSGFTAVQAGAAKIGTWWITEAVDDGGHTYTPPERYGFLENIDLGSADFSSDWMATGGGHRGRTHVWLTYGGYEDGQGGLEDGELVYGWPEDGDYYKNAGAWGTPDWGQVSRIEEFEDMLGPWFVVGGAFDGTTLSANGNLSVSMPTDGEAFSPSEWLDQVGVTNVSFDPGATEQTGTPGTDTYSYHSSNTGNGTTVVLSFDVTSDMVEIDGHIVNPNQGEAGITLAQVGGNVEIAYGAGAKVVLDGVSLSDWQEATATAAIIGTSGADILVGTSDDDVIKGLDNDDQLFGDAGNDQLFGGAGNDVIAAGSGDDTIIYTSGNDVISGYRAVNYGHDTLDLSRYTADQVSFRIVGHDVFIDTPDGTIELEYQLRYEVGHSRSNIESILFSDGTLDEAGIASRAIADQGTPGDDVITGSFQSETIAGGTGNDILSGINGSDTFVFAVGDGVDHITDYNAANDTLEFTGISFADLTITQDGSDVVIEYGTGDQVIVENSLIANFNEPEFLFA